jgi:hypothetical protein
MVKFSNEFVLPHILSSIQEEVFIGGMLGDSGMEFSKASKYPRMKIDRQFRDKKYLEWQFSIFKNLCTETAFKEIERYDARYDKINKQVSFRTRAIPAFKSYYEKWYPNKKKIVPLDLTLTPLICAVWFADDGCVMHTGKKSLTLKIATDGFGYKGAKFLSDQLESILDCKFPIYKKGTDKLWFIKASTKSAISFIKYIEPELKNMYMDRKIDIWKNLNINDYDMDNFMSYAKLCK